MPMAKEEKLAAKFLLVMTAVAIPAFLYGAYIWPPTLATTPTSVQYFMLMFMAVLDAYVLGIGVAFLIFGWPLVRNTSVLSRREAIATFLAIAWILLSWWPHNNLQAIIGQRLAGGNLEGASYISALLYIEYVFRFLLTMAGVTLSFVFFSVLRRHPPDSGTLL